MEEIKKELSTEERTLKFHNDLLALMMGAELPVYAVVGSMEYAKSYLIEWGAKQMQASQENKPEVNTDVQDK